MKPLYVFIHIPKTGGKSFSKSVRNHLDEEKYSSLKDLPNKNKEKVFYLYGHDLYYGIHKELRREGKYILFLREPAKRIKSQYNHDIYNMGGEVNFWKWYKNQIKDEQCFLLSKKYEGGKGRKSSSSSNKIMRFLNVKNSKFLKMLGFKVFKILKSKRNKDKELENAKKLIDNCEFVSTTRNLNVNIPRILQSMELSNEWETKNVSSNKNEELSEETRDYLNEDNPYDCELIKYLEGKKCQ